MKTIRLTITALVIATLTSCFKDEAPNAECDITKVWVHTDNPTELFFQPKDTAINVFYDKTDITFTVRRKADITSLAPQFEITPGATITPANGSVQDFSKGPVVYTVTSESKEWSRQYTVSFKPTVQVISDTISFEFEQAEIYDDTKKKATYYKWYETQPDGTLLEYWTNANAGFAIGKSSAAPEEYPSVAVDGYNGRALKLTTCSIGQWGELFRRPLAAGNFFIGEFDVSLALINTLHTTRMGRPFSKKPLKVSGMYKYKAGDVFWRYVNFKIEEHPEIKDQAAIYAVFYRNHDNEGNEVMLYGEDSKTNPNIVAIAEVADIPETDSWTPFEMTFKYLTDIDVDELESQGYNLTIVFTSSTNGAFYEGAPGSTLYIDSVKLICESEE
ncbi:MAG: PCMD domain-containing protein [Prevotella sp.]